MRIKAKMLLPRRDLDASGNEIDPRQELVDKILEYKRYKEASEEMALLEAERLLAQKRGNLRAEMENIAAAGGEGTEIQTITVYKLAQSFEKVLKRLLDRTAKPQHVVVKYNYSMEGQRTYLIDRVGQQRRLNFETLFDQAENRIHAIFTFLSMLELIQARYLRIMTSVGRNNFILEWNADREPELDNGQTEDTFS
jgi:segregation and condensation protein A